MALEQELRRLAIWRNSTTLHQDSSEYNWKEQFFFVRLPALWSAHELSDFSQKAFRAVLTQAVWHVSVSLLLMLAQDGQSSAHLIEQHVWTHPVLMGLQGLTGLDVL